MTQLRKAELIAAAGARIARLLLATLRFRIVDTDAVLGQSSEHPVLLAFWHNRLFVMPHVFERCFPGRRGAALASASKDGELVAAFIRRFGIRAIRGSSSRRGGSALVEMKRALSEGYIIGMTPDGPRGPRYHVHSGLVKLAQISDALLVPVHVVYSAFWQLRSWDGFMIPKPFAQVRIIFDSVQKMPRTREKDGFE